MTRKLRNAIVLTVFLTAMILVATFAGGCDTLRLAPTEPQKQIALDTYQTAQTVNATGAAAQSPATQKLVSGTAAAVAYTGYPANPTITDYPATLQTAQVDAAKRPTVDDVAKTFDGWMELGVGVLGLFGGTLGVKAVKVLQLARQKATALKEVVLGNEAFKNYLESAGNTDALKAFSTAHTQVQTTATEQAVYAVRSEIPQTVTSVNAKSTSNMA